MSIDMVRHGAPGDPATRSEERFERFLTLEGCVNFRDIGGYRAEGGRTVAWRRIFRSDTLQWLTYLDTQYFDTLNIDAIVDLRSGEEIEYFGMPNVCRRRARYRHFPLLAHVRSGIGVAPESEYGLGPLYLGMLNGQRKMIADIISLIADDETDSPVIFCAAGKDRTGVVISVLLSLLGVSRRQVLEDYALSQRAASALITRIRSTSFYPRAVRAAARSAVVANPDWIAFALDSIIAEHGSVDAYATAAGVLPHTTERLRGKYLV